MAAITICSDFGAQGSKVCHCFHCFPIYLPKAYFMLKVPPKTLCDNENMGRRPELTFLRGRRPGGQEAHGEVLCTSDCCAHAQSCGRSVVSTSASPWTVTCWAPLSMRFPRPEYWSGLPFPPPGGLPNPGTDLASLGSPALQADSLPLGHEGSPR